MLLKAVGGRPLDQVVVDLSPLRVNGLFDDPKHVETFLVRWKAEILNASQNAGLELVNEASPDHDENEDDDDDVLITIDSGDVEAWASKPIWQLPRVSLTFIGERAKAKNMSKDLAKLWDIPEQTKDRSGGGAKNRRTAGAKKGGRTKMKGLSHHRKRGGGHRQTFF